MSLKWYPDVPAQRTWTITRDVVTVLLVVFFCWAGVRTHALVDDLSSIAEGVTQAGTSVQDGFGTVSDVLSNVPLVGGALGDALQGAGEGTGGNLATLGRQGEEAIHRLALLLGGLVVLIPTVLLAVIVAPRRVRQVRRLTAAAALLVDTHDPARRRMLAMRAAFGLPYATLLRYTSDPLGDLVADRPDALVAAALQEAGLRVPPPDAPGPGTPA